VAESKKKDEARKLLELKKQLDEERAVEGLRAVQAQSGLITYVCVSSHRHLLIRWCCVTDRAHVTSCHVMSVSCDITIVQHKHHDWIGCIQVRP
jgi:hypothetical protein